MSDTDSRLTSIEKTLAEHGGQIFELNDAVRRLEGGQARQAVAIQDLTSSFGEVIGALGRVETEFRTGRKDMLAAIGALSTNVMKSVAAQESWSAKCEERHKHVDHRFEQIEANSHEIREDLDNMSDESKVRYIQDLEKKIEEYKDEKKEKRSEKSKERLELRLQKSRLIGLVITGLLTGTGGTILLQWILEKMQ